MAKLVTADEVTNKAETVKTNRDLCDSLARAFHSTSTMPPSLTVGGKTFALSPEEIDAVYTALYACVEKRADDAVKWLNERGITI
ncbi:MAG: hypothetical protein ACKO0Z_07025 [Betaproteobacteria bacterium]